MEIINFKNNLLENLEKHKSKKCIKIINKNRNVVKKYFNPREETNIKIIKDFLNQLNHIIIRVSHSKTKRYYKIFEKVLNHKLFTHVLLMFQESTIFVKACRIRKKELIRWLLTMNMNYSVKDEYGKSALMYLCKTPYFQFEIKKILGRDHRKEILEETDKSGRTAIFYAVKLPLNLNILIKAGANLSHKDLEGNTVFTYCCKNEIYDTYTILLNKCETNIFNNEEKNGPMYLAENGRYKELKRYAKSPKTLNKDFQNKHHEGILSTLIQKIYQPQQKRHPNFYIPYFKMLKVLVDKEFDFNISIDEDGNTPLMFFIMIEDYCSTYYIIKYCKNLDLSLQNKNGEDAFSLALKLQNKYLVKYMMHHKSLNFKYNDSHQNNILIYFIIENKADRIKYILNRNKSLLNQTNVLKETPLIIATKLGRYKIMKTLLLFNALIDHQDYLGNTALYYAVDLKDTRAISLLSFYRANPHIKNNRSKSAWDLIQETKNWEELQEAYETPDMNVVIKPPKTSKPKPPSRNKTLISPLKLRKSRKEMSKRSSTSSNNDSWPTDISSIRPRLTSKYQSTIEFKMQDYENRYKPLPNSDILRIIAIDVYDLDRKGMDHMKVVGIQYELFYRLIILHSLKIIVLGFFFVT